MLSDPVLPHTQMSPPATIPYTRIPDAVLLDPRLNGTQLRIYAVIARRADRETASAFPSYATIAADANISRASAITGVAALVALGYLAKRAKQSGQGDATSNRYTIAGEGSPIFRSAGQNSLSGDRKAVQNIDHDRANAISPMVQNLDDGGLDAGPEPDSKNQKQDNKTQENIVARADAHDASAAAADPQLHLLLTAFQENIGTPTGMARQVIAQLAAGSGADCVRDAMSSRHTICGESSQISIPPGEYLDRSDWEVVQNFDHGSTNAIPPVVQNPDHGGVNAGPELDSKNQKQDNKTQENRVARADMREASAAATADPELQQLLKDFKDNIGALTAIAQQVIGELAAEHSVGQVRKAIQEAVIYEKRSLGYVRRVLRAWQREGRGAVLSSVSQIDCSVSETAAENEPQCLEPLVWPPPDLVSDLPVAPDLSDPAAAAWDEISRQLPQLGRLTKLVTPISIAGDVLTVSVSDERTLSVLTDTQRHLVDYVTRNALGDGAKIHVELVEQKAGVAR